MASTSLRNPAKWLLDFFRNTERDGVRVDENTMLGSPAIWYAINTIAGDVAKMPLNVMNKTAEGVKDIDEDHKVHLLLTGEPNFYQTADQFKEQLTAHALGWGNGRAAIIRTGNRPTELIPLQPDRTDTVMVMGKKYHVTMPEEDDPINFAKVLEQDPELLLTNDDVVVLADEDVLHIQGFGWNGWKGMSIATTLKNAIGIDLQQQKYADDGLRRGFAGEIMLEAPPGAIRDADEAKAFLEAVRKRHERGKDGETVGLLREGIKANVLNMSPSDSQFIENRAFSRQDIMLIFGLQHIPGDDSSVSYNSLEQKQLAYLASCLDRWLVRWETQCDSKLRTRIEKKRREVYFRFDRDTWIRTDIATKGEFLGSLLSSTIINRNEARERLDMNPVEGGDEFINPYTTDDGLVEEDDVDVEEDTTEEDMIEDRLNFLIQTEADRINQAAADGNLLDFMDGFYSKWSITLLNNSIPADRVKSLVEEHKNDVLELSGRSFSELEFQQSVRELTEQWRQRQPRDRAGNNAG